MNVIDFGAAFETLTGNPPFAWQRRLHAAFMRGEIPAAVELPTGLGKTSVMAIWLTARARGAPVPRRLVFAVDRRALVDRATDEALQLRANLTPDLSAALGLGGRALPISTLRGEFADDRGWMEDPESPAIVIGRADAIGAGLLFEGHAMPRTGRPLAAALLGCDALLVVDEAHDATPLLATVRAAAEPAIRGPEISPPPLRAMALSAAGGLGAPAFGLADEDLRDAALARRLRADKRLRIEDVDALDPVRLARRAWEMAEAAGDAARALVFVDAENLAAKVRDALAREAARRKAEAPALLLAGGRRGRERDELAEELRRLGFLAGGAEARRGPAFLVATAAGEVGADLDADVLLCDLAPWERMVQRLGRVNRRGSGAAEVRVIDDGGASVKLGEEKTRRAAARALLEELPSREDGARDASPLAIHALRDRTGLRERVAAASTPPPLRPALSRPLVEAWALTGIGRHPGRPEPGPWLRGWTAAEATTRIAFRAILPVRSGPGPGDAVVDDDDVRAFMSAAPPLVSELLEVETEAALRWLPARARAVAAKRPPPMDVDAGALSRVRRSEIVALAFDAALELRRAWRLADLLAAGEAGPAARRAEARLRRSMADGLLLVDARLGGLRDGLPDETAGASPSTADADPAWPGRSGGAAGSGEPPTVPWRVRAAPDGAEEMPAPWRLAAVMDAELDVSGEPVRRLEVWRWHGATTRALTAARVRGGERAAAETSARRIARAVGLPPEEVEAIALAARLHGAGEAAEAREGAADPRAGGRPRDGIVGAAGRRAPLDRRHELASLLAAEAVVPQGPTRDLILHLIAARRGGARPLVAVRGCHVGPPSRLEAAAGEAALRFARLQGRHGPWGLAFREAVLRAAEARHG